MTKRETITVMLRRYRDAQETLAGARENIGSDDAVMLMPITWNASFRELERCLRALRDRHPRLYWNVRERYVDPTIAVRELPVKNGRVIYAARIEHDGGAPEIGARTARVRVRCWDERVQESEVSRGIDFLMREFNGVPFLHDEMAA